MMTRDEGNVGSPIALSNRDFKRRDLLQNREPIVD